MLGQVSMPCVLQIKGSFFCPATFLEVIGLFWLQLLRKLGLNSVHTTSAQKVYRVAKVSWAMKSNMLGSYRYPQK